ncbi:DUF7305 domain-containing protein [Thalassotalea sp. ND16A]|uniref:DUF7305 domain-containing protein n=1 Tax=Thalassotalea sp. ND16A TaxID=1535422 RepID=UPI00051A7967|nr:hypothetical protein [Thalassotalea sp. ND16A]KGJ88151.1 hypothetical protein ND16A_2704 [Thalassotalea sp. ND16A]
MSFSVFHSKSPQPGFTIVTVLILVVMCSIVAINSLKDNIIQERLSGNFQKKINARLISEKGIFDTFTLLNNKLKEEPGLTLEQLINETSDNGSITGHAGGIENLNYDVSLSAATNELQLSSNGQRFEGLSTLKANYTFIPATTPVPEEPSGYGLDGVVACEAMNIATSVTFDSYDSSIGSYDSQTAGEDILVGTNTNGADSGAGRVEIDSGTNVMGDLKSASDIVGSASVSGTTQTNYTSENPCDSLQAVDPLNDFINDHSGGLSDVNLNSSGDHFTLDNVSGKVESAELFGETKQIYMYDNITIKDGQLKVAPGVEAIVFVQGNLKMEGSGKIVIPDTSSLTLLMQGEFYMDSDAQVNTPDYGLSPTGNPVFMIYSGYGGTGVTFKQKSDVYAVIYAPESVVTIESEGDVLGAIVAKEVLYKGSGDFHYDVALAADGGSNTSTEEGEATESKLVFNGWKF